MLKHQRELNVFGAGEHKFHQTGFNRSYHAKQGPTSEYFLHENQIQKFGRVVQYGYVGIDFKSEEELFAPGEYVVNVSCGERCSLFVTNHRRVFCCGDNTEGSCGMPKSISVVRQITLIPELTNCNIVEVKCGKDHTFFISEGYGCVYAAGSNSNGECGFLATQSNDNCVYSSGYCEFGSLGQGYPSKGSLTPRRVNHPDLGGFLAIKTVVCGQCHSIVVTENGSAYSWGDNYQGQCGSTSLSDEEILSPALVRSLPLGEKVVDARCGLTFTVFRTESNKFYGCGGNAYGVFGVPIVSLHQELLVTEIPLSIGNVFDFCCGSTFVVFTTEEGRVYIGGESYYCGLSKDSSQDGKLMEVSLPGPSQSMFRIACGQAGLHTLLYGVLKSRCHFSSKLFATQQKGLLCDIAIFVDDDDDFL